MRNKYLKIFKSQVKKHGLIWLARQGNQYFKILLSAYRGRVLTGPISAVITLTYRCNQSCTMCDYPSRVSSNQKEMTTDQIKSLLDEIAALPSSGVSFYGGEPLLRPDLEQLIFHADRLGLMIHVNTNGYRLDAARAEAIVRAGADVISLSLDGANHNTHDRQRGQIGAFVGVTEAIGHIIKARTASGRDTKVAVSTTVTPHNINEISDIIELTRRLGADCITVFEAQPLATLANAFTLQDRDRLLEINTNLFNLKNQYPDYIDNSRAYLKIVRKLLLEEEVRFKCFAPYTDLFISPYGEVFPCDPLLGLNRPIGKFEPGKLRRLWYSQEYQKKRNELSDCGLCNHQCHRELSSAFDRFWLRPRPKISSQAIKIDGT